MAMLTSTELTRRIIDLQEEFFDSIDRGTSLSAIVVQYWESGQISVEVGVPYEISGQMLILGPYAKDIRSSVAQDFDSRKKAIDIEQIMRYKRIEIDHRHQI